MHPVPTYTSFPIKLPTALNSDPASSVWPPSLSLCLPIPETGGRACPTSQLTGRTGTRPCLCLPWFYFAQEAGCPGEGRGGDVHRGLDHRPQKVGLAGGSSGWRVKRPGLSPEEPIVCGWASCLSARCHCMGSWTSVMEHRGGGWSCRHHLALQVCRGVSGSLGEPWPLLPTQPRLLLGTSI